MHGRAVRNADGLPRKLARLSRKKITTYSDVCLSAAIATTTAQTIIGKCAGDGDIAVIPNVRAASTSPRPAGPLRSAKSSVAHFIGSIISSCALRAGLLAREASAEGLTINLWKSSALHWKTGSSTSKSVTNIVSTILIPPHFLPAQNLL